jgi:subtilisin family serine protease
MHIIIFLIFIIYAKSVCLDKFALENNLKEIHESGLTGKGVIIATTEELDFRLPDFRLQDGRTRILYYRGKDSSEINEILINYPINEYIQIDSLYTFPYGSLHGTLTTSIATGNGATIGKNKEKGEYIGIAPEANIVVLTEYLFDLGMLDSIANYYNNPIVFNFSIPEIYAKAKYIDSVSNNHKGGKIFIGSAGNNNSNNAYKKEYLKGDTSSIFIWYDSNSISTNIRTLNDASDHVSIDLKVFSLNGKDQVDSNINITLISKFDTTFTFNIQDTPSYDSELFYRSKILDDSTFIEERLLYNIQKRISYWYRQSIKKGEKVMVNPWGFKIKRNNSSYNSTVIIKFEDAYHFLTSIPEYPKLNFEFNTLSGVGNELNMISVGASIHRSWNWIDSSLINTLALFSGRGPSIDYYNNIVGIKPDIIAPGHGIIGILRNSDIADSIHGYGTGTSCAAPIVTGLAALMLQKNPGLTQNQVKEIIHATAIQDEYTGVTPNNAWGWGRLNFQGALNEVTDIKRRPVNKDHVKDMVIKYNPFHYSLILCFPNSTSLKTINIYTLTGKIVKQINTREKTATWNTQCHENGVYYIRAMICGKNIVKKIVI